ncbi:rhsG core protein with extension [Escherichia coli]|nr:rhsG core protein with extension [Escherichia coli]EFN4791834.1 rhsG core protein with extension [Escherichia coli]EFN8204786.1 rhsG core protein with extension [Escherichia coli]EFN8289931.1 rhsG core protein with extension [Escherichia coli]EFO3245542.1 rhsG core protein with extension [Escherichia coli]
MPIRSSYAQTIGQDCLPGRGQSKNSFAQKLANELDATVIAPDEIIWIWPDGNYAIMGQTARITIGGKDNGAFELVPDEKQPGDFHKFTPTGSK